MIQMTEIEARIQAILDRFDVSSDQDALDPDSLECSITKDENFPLNCVINADNLHAMKRIPDDSVHAIITDIPYGISAEDWDVLHNNTNSALRGSSPAQQKAGRVFKSRGKPINGWSEADRAIPREYQNWCATWAGEWLRILKPGGSAIVFAGRRFMHRCVCALEDAGFSTRDILAWERPRAVYRAQRLSIVFERRGDSRNAARFFDWRVGNLRPTFEPVLWFVKPYKIGTTIADNMLNHGVGAYNEKGFSRYASQCENVLQIGMEPGEGGLHPTQKPVRLMQALIALVTDESHLVLDPFAGSGSTLVAAKNLNRNYLGIEADSHYAEIAKKRLAPDLFSTQC